MQFVTFDDSLVAEIQQSLEAWHHVSSADAWQDEESMQQDEDRMHCSEAWRHGLLLYIYRIFRWTPNEAVPLQVVRHARTVTDHVFSCRDAGYLAKQAALPLLWAGCELTDLGIRGKIADFCTFWSGKTRYRLLDHVMPLLNEVWLAHEIQGHDNVCWTSVIDRWHALGQTNSSLPETFCLG